MVDLKKKNGSKHIDTRLGALRSELDALQSDMKGLAGDVGNAADGRVHLAIRNAENVGSALSVSPRKRPGAWPTTWRPGPTNIWIFGRESIKAQPLSRRSFSRWARARLSAPSSCAARRPMRLPNVATAVLGLIAAALVLFGVAFLGAAIMLALQPRLGGAASAAVAGLVLLLPPCIWAVTAGFRRPALPPPRPTLESAVVSLLSGLARDKPLLAVLGAALFATAEVLLRGRKDKHGGRGR